MPRVRSFQNVNFSLFARNADWMTKPLEIGAISVETQVQTQRDM